MKKLSIVFLISWFPFFTRALPALQQVVLQVCTEKNDRCLSLESKTAETSFDQNSYMLWRPVVHGLNLEGRSYSSAFIDVTNKQIILREVQRGHYRGEWLIQLADLTTQFFPASPKNKPSLTVSNESR